MFAKRKIENTWDGRIEPFRIIGNVYFVGTFQASTHLIDTGDGLILIDPGYHKTFYLVIDSIYKLGFKPSDIKYIVNTHWHYDHAEATEPLKDLSGAVTVIGAEDFESAKAYFTADVQLHDGDHLRLGNVDMLFLETPGHTKGTLSFFFDTVEDGRTLRVGMFGGAGRNTLVQGKFDFEGCREAYRASIWRLKGEHVDVFLGNHTWNNDTEGKGKHLMETGENLFVDETLWCTFLDYCLTKLDEIEKKETKQL